jgi:hypothetical protein
MWVPGISLAAMGILVSGGYQLLKLWIITRFFLLGYIRSADDVPSLIVEGSAPRL